MKTYNWKYSTVIYDYPLTIFKIAGSNLVKDIRDHSEDFARPYEITFDSEKMTNLSHYSDILLEAKFYSRGNDLIIFILKYNFFIYYTHNFNFYIFIKCF